MDGRLQRRSPHRTARTPASGILRRSAPALLSLLVASAGCSKKAEKPAAARKPPVAPAAPAEPRPGIEFTDPAQQRRYEQGFGESLSLFEPPRPGSAAWFALRDGRKIGGRIVSLSPDAVRMETGGGVRLVAGSELAAESRARLFAGDFARSRAMGLVAGRIPGPSAEVPARDIVRHVMSEEIVVRAGPGSEYRRVPGLQFERGQPVSFCDDFDGWLRLKDGAGTPQAWIPKYLTYALDELDPSALAGDIERLSRMGLVRRIDPAQNEVDVDPEIWRGTEPELRMGMARLLAAYCATARSNTMVFVTIRDGATQKKLGKYSQSLGWKDSTL